MGVKMDRELMGSVIIATYRRGHLIKHCLESLARQTYGNFETVVVYKPNGDETEKVLSLYKEKLNMKIIAQESGYFTHALNMGLKNARGDIILFLDDDAIAFPDWIEQHIKIYRERRGMGAVQGLVISANLVGDRVKPLKVLRGERIFYKPWKVWLKPLEGLESYRTYFGENGLVLYSRSPMHVDSKVKEFPSLTESGVNMSFLAEAVRGLSFDTETMLGNRNEPLIALQIWRRGYKTIGNLKARVYHLVHEASLSRWGHNWRWYVEWTTEEVLTFFKLKKLKVNVKWTHFIIYLPIFIYRILKQSPTLKQEPFYACRIIGVLYGLALGFKWALSDYEEGLIFKKLKHFYF